MAVSGKWREPSKESAEILWKELSAIGIATAGVASYLGLDHLHHNYERDYSVKPGDTVLDVGASQGRFTRRYAKKPALVIAVEPEPRNVEILRNMASHLNILVLPMAVWNRRESLPLHLTGQNPGQHNVVDAKSIMVQADTLDNITSYLDLETIDFIKMDIEGAELEALEGAKATLERTKNIAIAAYHIRDGKPTYHRVISALERHDFEVGPSTLLPPLMGIVYGKQA